jgi:hypothetical protein
MKRHILALLLLTFSFSFSFTALAVSPFATPLPMLPHFVPALVKHSLMWKVQALSTYEMTTVLRLHPEISSDPTLESQMQFQLQKLKRLMPLRAAEMEKMWLEISHQLKDIQMDLAFPPGLFWNELAKPIDANIQPVAAVALFYDGRRSYYLDRVLFPKLTPFDQAQVIWQLLWSQSLQIEDNMAIRTISNYLFSKEWSEIAIPQSLPLLKTLGFTYFESQGLCFDINSETKFYSNGKIQSGTASDKCLISFGGQFLRLKGPVEMDPEGKLSPQFHLSPDTLWKLSWQGTRFRFANIELFDNGHLQRGRTDTQLPNDCANEMKPARVITRYAIFFIQCLHEVSFFPNGNVERISNAQAWIVLQGQNLLVGDNSLNGNSPSGELRFYENGALKSGYFAKGTRLKYASGEMTELENPAHLILNANGSVVGQY